MKRLVLILATLGFLFTTSCAGVYLKSGKTNAHDAFQNFEGWYWYDGYDNLDDCVKAWNEGEPK